MRQFLFFQYYKNELKPLLGDPEKIDKKFKAIVAQRENRKHSIDVKVLMPDGTQAWQNIDDYLMQK